MTRIAEKLALALGFDADPACSIDTYSADILTDDGTVEERDYIVIADGYLAWAADGYDIARWLDAGGSDYQDLCDAVECIDDVQIALDFYEQTGGILTGTGGGVVASSRDLDALADIPVDATIEELVDDADTNHLVSTLVDYVESGFLSRSANARQRAIRFVMGAAIDAVPY